MDLLKSRLEQLNFSEVAQKIDFTVNDTMAIAQGWATRTTFLVKQTLSRQQFVAAVLVVVLSVVIQTAFLSPKPVRKARGTKPLGYWYLALAMAISKFMLITFLAHVPSVEGFDVTRAISMFIPVFGFSAVSVLSLHFAWVGARSLKFHQSPTSFCRDGFEWFSNTYTCAMWTTMFQSLYSSRLFASESSALRALRIWPVLDATADTFLSSMHRFRTMFLVTTLSMTLLCMTEFIWVRIFRIYFQTKSPWFRFISSGIPFSARKRSGDSRPSIVLAQESVTWYSIYITSTALDVILSAMEFLGRSRAREVQASYAVVHTCSDDELLSRLGVFDLSKGHDRDNRDDTGSSPEGHLLPRGTDETGFWFDWVADVGDGFNATYAVATQLAQPELEVYRPPEQWGATSVPSAVRVPVREGASRGPTSLQESSNDQERPPSVDSVLQESSSDQEANTTSANTLRRRSNRIRRNRSKTPSRRARPRPSAASPSPTETKKVRRSKRLASVLVSQSLPEAEEPASDKAAELLADDWQSLCLPRGKLLLIGGDLAYPNPTEENFESRLFYPYECAMPPVRSFNAATNARRRPVVLKGEDSIASADLCAMPDPVCFAIPGNHDWLDGGSQFELKIIRNDHLGAWKLPQTRGHFAIRLPHNWWVLGVDNGLTRDMNFAQFEHLCKVAEAIPQDGNVILVTHEPDFVLNEWMRLDVGGDRRTSGGVGGGAVPDAQFTHQLQQVLGKRLRLRLAGDLHHYSRYSNDSESTHWVVAGGGGAFMHPTHVFPTEIPSGLCGRMHNITSFPNREKSRTMAWWNLWQFRRNNWLFDCLGAFVYYFLIYSVFENHMICNSFNSIIVAESVSDVVLEFCRHVIHIQMETLSLGASVSSFTALILLIVCCNFSGGMKLQTLAHFYVHWFSSIGILVSMRVLVFLGRISGVITDPGEIYAKLTSELQPSITRCNNGFVQHFGVSKSTMVCSQSLKSILSFFEWPEQIWELSKHCSAEVQEKYESSTYTGGHGVVFHVTFFALYWMLASIVVSFVFSVYLALYGYFGNHHYDEPYSSLRCEGFKNFLRMHINEQGTLSMYAIGMETVPTSWMKDPEWSGTHFRQLRQKHSPAKKNLPPAYRWKNPSKFAASPSRVSDAPCLIDYFRIEALKKQ